MRLPRELEWDPIHNSCDFAEFGSEVTKSIPSEFTCAAWSRPNDTAQQPPPPWELGVRNNECGGGC